MKKTCAFLIFGLSFSSLTGFAEGIKHLPQAPSWNYSAKGEVSVGAVGNDYCDMDSGETCDGANVLITGKAALVIYNQLSQQAVGGLKTSKGIECTKEKCLFHIQKNGPAAGETPWISD